MSRHRHDWDYIDRGGEDGHAKPARILIRDPRPEPGATIRQFMLDGPTDVPVKRGHHRLLSVTGWCSGCGAVRCRDPQNRKRIFRPSEAMA